MKNMLCIATVAALFLGLTVNVNAAKGIIVKTPGTGSAGAGKLASDTASDCDDKSNDVACTSAEGVQSPRDHASGMASGKRMHKPMPVTKELGKSPPNMGDAAGQSPAPETESGANRGISSPTGSSSDREMGGGCQAKCRENNQGNPDALAACLRECGAVGPASGGALTTDPANPNGADQAAPTKKVLPTVNK